MHFKSLFKSFLHISIIVVCVCLIPFKLRTLVDFLCYKYFFPLYSLLVFSINTVYDHCCCSVTKSCPNICNSMDCSMPDFPVLHYLLEFAQSHVLQVCDAIQPSHPLSPCSPPALNLSPHHGLFQSVGSSHPVAKVLEL